MLFAPAPLALVTAGPAPTAAAATTAFAALALAWSVERRHARGLRRGSGHARAQPDLVLAVVELREGDEALVRRLYHELREAREPQILLVERRIDLLHDLLQAVGPHHVAMRGHLLHGLDHQLPGIVPLVRDVALFREAGQLVVGVVLVAVLDQQVARRFADPHADDVLAVLLELQHEGRKVGIARQQDERADLGPREHELEASTARRMSVAFFLFDPYAGAQIMSI